MISPIWSYAIALLAIIVGFIYMSAPYWWYIILVVNILVIFAFIVYRGYNRIKPTPVVGIPCPPLTHPVLGHPDLMVNM